MLCPPKLTLRKKVFFVIEKSIEDARQDEKRVPDLLESIMRANLFVKEELRPILFEMTKIKSIFKKSGFQLFGFWKSKVFPPEANASLLTGKF